MSDWNDYLAQPYKEPREVFIGVTILILAHKLFMNSWKCPEQG